MNATNLSLVPKNPGATLITDYRPIACCNIVYKAISKLLVHTLKPILPKVVLPNQTTFVQGRLQRLCRITIGKDPKRITIKVDIAKAIRWEFIFQCLRGLKVPESYLRWLEACICTASYSVGFNGSTFGYFKEKEN